MLYSLSKPGMTATPFASVAYVPMSARCYGHVVDEPWWFRCCLCAWCLPHGGWSRCSSCSVFKPPTNRCHVSQQLSIDQALRPSLHSSSLNCLTLSTDWPPSSSQCCWSTTTATSTFDSTDQPIHSPFISSTHSLCIVKKTALRLPLSLTISVDRSNLSLLVLTAECWRHWYLYVGPSTARLAGSASLFVSDLHDIHVHESIVEPA